MRRLEIPLIVPWIRLDQDAKSEELLAIRRARDPSIAGFCLFGGDAEGVKALTSKLRDAAGRKPLFIASDMERGAGQQVKGLRVLPDAGVFGVAASPDEALEFGRATAMDARSVGVDVLFAPVIDVRSELSNPIVGNRSFGFDPGRVSTLACAFIDGAIEGGAVPTAKHYPGHGATVADSHDAVPVVSEPARTLIARDLQPFLEALHCGCPAVMTAHVSYPSLDPTGAIATFSKPILDHLFATLSEPADIAVFTDALLMSGALGGGSETDAARKALLAGCHGLLIPTDPERLAAEVLDGADREMLDAAATGAEALRRLGETARVLLDGRESRGPIDDEVFDRVAARALKLSGGDRIEKLARGARIVVIDDDGTADRGLVIERRARAAGVGVVLLRLGRGAKDPLIPPGTAPAAVVVMSSVRAWKGAADVSPLAESILGALRRATPTPIVVRLTPRAGLYCVNVPGGGPAVESALCDLWFGSTSSG